MAEDRGRIGDEEIRGTGAQEIQRIENLELGSKN